MLFLIPLIILRPKLSVLNFHLHNHLFKGLIGFSWFLQSNPWPPISTWSSHSQPIWPYLFLFRSLFSMALSPFPPHTMLILIDFEVPFILISPISSLHQHDSLPPPWLSWLPPCFCQSKLRGPAPSARRPKPLFLWSYLPPTYLSLFSLELRKSLFLFWIRIEAAAFVPLYPSLANYFC
jgi:hypothetical protein